MSLFLHLTSFLGKNAHAAIGNVNLPTIGGVAPGLTPAAFVRYLFVVATFFVGAAAVIMLIVGGVAYLASSGNPEQANKAKERIQSALVGLVLVFAAVAMLWAINPDLVRLRDTSLPIVQLPQAQAPTLFGGPPGSCQLTAASWGAAQICKDTTLNFYPNVALAAAGINCEDWTVALNIVNKNGNTTVKTIAGTMSFANNLSVAWNPTDQSPPVANPDGTYYFEAIAGSGNVQTRIQSGDLVVTSQGICIVSAPVCTSQQCPAVTVGKCTVNNLASIGCFNGHECEASGICRAESNGVETSESVPDRCNCQPNPTFPSGCKGEVFTFGLFQINIAANNFPGVNCPDAFRTFANPVTGNPTKLYRDGATNTYYCEVVNQTLYQTCVSIAKIGEQSIQKACDLSRNGTNWSAWSTNSVCGF